MNILFLEEEKSQNPVNKQLIIEIKEHYPNIVIQLGVDKFWNTDLFFDIVHIQWPELIFSWKRINKLVLERYKNRLKEISKKSIIFITRHNIRPHNRKSNLYKEVYYWSYYYSNVVLHYGENSIDDFKKRYNFSHLQHFIIPHPLYDCYSNSVNQIESKTFFGVKLDSTVILSFSRLKNFHEKYYLILSFYLLPNKNKVLLTSKWKYFRVFPFYQIENRFLKYFKNIFPFDEYVEDEKIQYYFNAADVVFLTRIKSLNSGLVILAFSFGKVVVGPDEGVIGEILKSTGNPVYIAGNVKSMVNALKQGIDLSKENFGIRNLEYGQKNWSGKLVAKKLYELYAKHAEFSTNF